VGFGLKCAVSWVWKDWYSFPNYLLQEDVVHLRIGGGRETQNVRLHLESKFSPTTALFGLFLVLFAK
jgi:hypothetical protein